MNNKPNTSSSRAIAAKIIFDMLQNGQSLSTAIPFHQQKLINLQDHALVQEICYGVARQLSILDLIIAKLLTTPIANKNKIVYCLIVVGLYQLIYMRVPDYAAVDQVISATKELKVEKFKPLINAVLRNFLRQKNKILTEIDQQKHTLHPEWLINKIKFAYPDDWQEILKNNNEKPPMWIRINLAKISAIEYINSLKNMNVEAISGPLEQAVLILTPIPAKELPFFDQGFVFVQDLHAQYSALLLEPENDDTILDTCAAPGGKTTHILELAPKAKVIALDIEKQRLAKVKENLARLQQKARIVCGDARFPEKYFQPNEMFNKIIVDAPCSAIGIIRRHPDIKWLRQERDIQKLHHLQLQILTAVWNKLMVKGVLLYVTCSVLPDENYRVIKQFLSQTSNAKIVDIHLSSATSAPYGVQLLPSKNSGDGFYFAKLMKTC